MQSLAMLGTGLLLMTAGAGADALQSVPPAGYAESSKHPDVARKVEPGAPPLIRVPDASLSDRFHVDPTYPHNAHVKVVGAFVVAEQPGMHVTAAWSPGFLPVALKFSDGRCFLLDADYDYGTLSNGHLTKASCSWGRRPDEPRAPKPPNPRLRLIGTSWGYHAWLDPRSETTIVTAPYEKSFVPLFTARMKAIAIMAMNGPDFPGGNVTLVGTVDSRLMVVTLEVGW